MEGTSESERDFQSHRKIKLTKLTYYKISFNLSNFTLHSIWPISGPWGTDGSLFYYINGLMTNKKKKKVFCFKLVVIVTQSYSEGELQRKFLL